MDGFVGPKHWLVRLRVARRTRCRGERIGGRAARGVPSGSRPEFGAVRDILHRTFTTCSRLFQGAQIPSTMTARGGRGSDDERGARQPEEGGCRDADRAAAPRGVVHVGDWAHGIALREARDLHRSRGRDSNRPLAYCPPRFPPNAVGRHSFHESNPPHRVNPSYPHARRGWSGRESAAGSVKGTPRPRSEERKAGDRRRCPLVSASQILSTRMVTPPRTVRQGGQASPMVPGHAPRQAISQGTSFPKDSGKL